jgi:hypothetical protein
MKKTVEFIHAYSWFLGISAVLLIAAFVFLPIPKENHGNANYAMGYISGVLTAVVTFYFGGIKKQTPPPNSTTTTEITQVVGETEKLD